jgi:hypothetical protein
MGWGMRRRISKAINVVTYSGLDLTPFHPSKRWGPAPKLGNDGLITVLCHVEREHDGETIASVMALPLAAGLGKGEAVLDAVEAALGAGSMQEFHPISYARWYVFLAIHFATDVGSALCVVVSISQWRR